jgi:ABC-type nitrate/sulfonate/bicarbonate transport system ATPase subunit
MSQVKINNVTKSFGDTQVLEQINLQAENGEFLVLVGASGCGKSTFSACRLICSKTCVSPKLLVTLFILTWLIIN